MHPDAHLDTLRLAVVVAARLASLVTVVALVTILPLIVAFALLRLAVWLGH